MRSPSSLLVPFSHPAHLPPAAATTAAPVSHAPSHAQDFEGNACPAVTFGRERARRQSRLRNDPDRPSQEEVTTFAPKGVMPVPARRGERLEVETFKGSYRAIYL